MAISIRSSFAFTTQAPTDALMQFAVADIPEQHLLRCRTGMTDAHSCTRIPAQEDIGERVWARADGRFEIHHEAEVEIRRQIVALDQLEQLLPSEMPAAPVKYLFDSRYCLADKFQSFVEDQFGGTSGGARVEAIRSWVADKFTYAPGSSDANTTALDSFVERRGICRDYAHMVVTLARASVIPARFVACYAPDVTPPDFHAVAEVFLKDPSSDAGGTWQLVDATGMGSAEDIVKIGVGRDAADVSFLTTFGVIELCEKTVEVRRS
jgi:transglutaminase-like putative cysteine protease